MDGFDDDYKIVYIGEPAECDKTFVFGSEFNNLEVVSDMPCYPDTGSISIVDDVVIVKFQ